MAIPLACLDAEVEIVCERNNLITLQRETLIRIALTSGEAVLYEGFAIVGEDGVFQLRDFYRGD